MNSRHLAISASVVVSFAASVMAVPQTVVKWDVSSDGGTTWQTSLDALPGTTLKFRLRTSLINNTGAGRLNAGGMIGFNTLPSLSNWGAGDTVGAFAPEAYYVGSNDNPVPNPLPGPYPLPAGTIHGSGVLNGGNGRQAPFGMNGTNGNGVPTSRAENGNLLLSASIVSDTAVAFSQFPQGLSTVYAWDGHTYRNTDTGDLGVDPPASEIADGLWSQHSAFAGSFFRSGVTDITVFIYTVTLDAGNVADRILTQSSSVPINVYYGPAIGVMPTSRTSEENNLVQSASVHVIPAPAGAAVFGVVGLVAMRRRRG